MKIHTRILTLIGCCWFSTMSFASVELDNDAFNQIKQDMTALLLGQSTERYANIQVIEQANRLEIRPALSSQGFMIIKLPIKLEDVNILQAPHQFFDLHTGDIARLWFEREDIHVLMLNTTHRYDTDRSDLSRLERSFFTATISAFIEAKSSGKVIQVHGFNEDKRKTVSAQYADFILSNGQPEPYSDFVTMQSCLRDSSQLLARAYGRDVFELGATINPVGRLINRSADSGLRFLHIEMPRPIRIAMKEQEIAGDPVTCLLQH